jgi:hypothetical protein
MRLLGMQAKTDRAGSEDSQLLDLAEAEARIVVTLDKDFWQIALQRHTPVARAGVWFCFGFIPPRPRISFRLFAPFSSREGIGRGTLAPSDRTESRWSGPGGPSRRRPPRIARNEEFSREYDR